MSLQQDWNGEKLKIQREDSILQRSSSLDKFSIKQRFPSITPINRYQTPIQSVSPFSTTRRGGINYDSIYDLSKLDQPAVVIPTDKNMACSQSSSGQKLSLARTWKHSDTEDVANQTRFGASEPHEFKRRKSVFMKKPMSSTTRDSKFEESQHNCGQTSQANPINIRKRITTRSLSVNANAKEPHLRPFKKSIISEQVQAPEASSITAFSPAKQISTYRGWVSTQATVQLGFNGLAKTTLEKLAAFRYKSTSADQVTENISLDSNDHKLEKPLDLQVDCIIQTHDFNVIEPYTMSTQDKLVLGNRYSTSALDRSVATASQDQTNLTKNEEAMTLNANLFVKKALCSADAVLTHIENHRADGEDHSDMTENLENHDGLPDCEAPKSSDFSARLKVVDIVTENHEEKLGSGKLPERPESPSKNLLLQQRHDAIESARSPSITDLGQTEPFCDSKIESEAFELISLPEEQILNPGWMRNGVSDIEFESSGFYDFDQAASNITRHYNADEFDEGLDDRDFLAAADEVVSSSESIGTKSNGKGASKLQVHHPTVTPFFNSSEKNASMGIDILSSPQISNLESGGFCMNEELEKETSTLSDFDRGALGGLASSTSLHYCSNGRLLSEGTAAVHAISESHGEPSSKEYPAVAKIKRLIGFGGFDTRNSHNKESEVSATTSFILDDSHEFEAMAPFARPDFPSLTRDRSPIIGLSSDAFLRVCFRIGEMLTQCGRCSILGQNAVVELFARVVFSSREIGFAKQYFQFADLWHDRPPFPKGILTNYKASDIIESESGVFVGADEGALARVLGMLKRDTKQSTGWVLHIISIRKTDWEEIRWTKRIVSAGVEASEIRLGKEV